MAVADLVLDLGTARPHLVRLPEHRDLRRERVGDVLAVVESREELGDAHVRGQHRPARGFGGMRGQDELERDGRSGVELGERGGERLARHAVLTRIGAAVPDAVVLLGDVGDLEVEGEGAEDARLARERERLHRLPQLVAPLALPRGAGERPDVLDVGEQRFVLLLDEHAAEEVAEQADVAAYGFHKPSVARTCLQNRTKGR